MSFANGFSNSSGELGQSQINKKQESKHSMQFNNYNWSHSAWAFTTNLPGVRHQLQLLVDYLWVHYLDVCLWNWKQLAKCAGDLEQNVIALIAQEHTHTRSARKDERTL